MKERVYNYTKENILWMIDERIQIALPRQTHILISMKRACWHYYQMIAHTKFVDKYKRTAMINRFYKSKHKSSIDRREVN